MTTVALTVFSLLIVCIGANLIDFPRIESSIAGGWRAIAPSDPGNIERPSFSRDRYGLYFALRDHTDGVVLITTEELSGNATGRYLGLAEVTEIVPSSADPQQILDSVDVDAHLVAEGAYADGDERFQLALLDEEASELVLVEGPDGPVVIDLRLIPVDLQAELVP